MGFIDSYIKGFFDTGKHGEILTEFELRLVQLFGRNGKILRNVYLPKDNGETSEVDVVFITQKGIFVFESKNYSGWIFGNEKDMKWTASLASGQKNRFYNPVMQNKTHIKYMKKLLGEDIPMFSIIAFSDRCELKKITLYSNNVKVIHREETYATIRSIWNVNPDVLSDERVNEVYEKLKTFVDVSEDVKKKHVEDVKRFF